MLEEVGVGLHIEEIVYGRDLQLFGMSLEYCLENLSADAAETVYAYADHKSLLG
jgi:hypothetical protein